jgi:hypothetical protein
VSWLAVAPILTALVASFDAWRNGVHGFGWLNLLGYALAIAGAGLTHVAMAANRFYAPVVRIQRDRGHRW